MGGGGFLGAVLDPVGTIVGAATGNDWNTGPLGTPDPLDIHGGQAAAAAEEQAAEQAQQATTAAGEAAQIQAEAARYAADIQAEMAEKGIAEQQRQFDVTQKRMAPWTVAGSRGLSEQLNLLGLGSPVAPSRDSFETDAEYDTAMAQYESMDREGYAKEQQQAAFDRFQESPGAKYLREQAEKSVLRNAAAIGGLGGGNVRKALQDRAANLASQEYSNYYNRLAGISGTGQTTANQLGALGSQTAANVGNLYSQTGQAIGAGALGAAQAQAQGILSAQQANQAAAMQQQQIAASNRQGMMSTLGTLGGAAMMMFSDVNLKKDIKDFTDSDLKACYEQVLSMNIKKWSYKDGYGLPDGEFIGPMYQDSRDNIKVDNRALKALDIHKENMLIAGALQYLHKFGGKV